MSGISIDSGGAISVDPEALRDVARRMDLVTAHYDDAHAAIVRAQDIVAGAPEVASCVGSGALWASAARVGALRDECAEATTGTLLMADVYEYVELQAAAEFEGSAFPDDMQLRMEQLATSDERIPQMAAMLIEGWKNDRFEGLGDQPTWHGLMTPIFLAAAGIGTFAGRGKIPPGATLDHLDVDSLTVLSSIVLVAKEYWARATRVAGRRRPDIRRPHGTTRSRTGARTGCGPRPRSDRRPMRRYGERHSQCRNRPRRCRR